MHEDDYVNDMDTDDGYSDLDKTSPFHNVVLDYTISKGGAGSVFANHIRIHPDDENVTVAFIKKQFGYEAKVYTAQEWEDLYG